MIDAHQNQIATLSALPEGVVVSDARGNRYEKVAKGWWESLSHPEAGEKSVRVSTGGLPVHLEIEDSIALVGRMFRWAQQNATVAHEHGMKTGEERNIRQAFGGEIDFTVYRLPKSGVPSEEDKEVIQ